MKKLKSLSLTILILLSGCSLKPRDQATVRLAFPPAPQGAANRALQAPRSSQRSLIGLPSPTTLDDFTCFGVNVTAEDIPSSTAIAGCSAAGMPQPGLVGGLAPISGGVLELSVPYGTHRTFQLFAVQSRNGSCDAITDAVVGTFGSLDLDVPMEVGRVTSDVLGNTSLSIKAAWDPNAPKPMFCPKGTGIPSSLSLTGPIAPILPAACAMVSATLLDGAGSSVAAPYAVTLSFGGQGSGAWYSDASCSTASTGAVSLAAGASSTTLYLRGNAPQNLNLTVSAPGLTAAQLPVVVQNPTASKLAFSAQPPSSIAADGAFSVGVQATDLGNNLIATATDTVTLSAYTDATCATPAPGTFVASPSNLTAGQTTISGLAYRQAQLIYIRANASGLTGACSTAITVGPGAAAPGTTTLVASPSSGLNADGVASSTITATLLDAYGNPINGVSVGLVASGGGTNLTPVSSITNAAGQATYALNATTPGMKSVSFSTPASVSGNSVGVSFITSSVSAAYSSIAASANTVADGSATASIIITLRDASSTPVSGVVPTFSATDTGSTNVYGTCTSSDASGISNCTLTSTYAETKTLALASPVSVAGPTISFDAGPATNFQASPLASVTAGQTQSVTLTAIDLFGNVVANYTGTVQFTSTDPQAVLPADTTFAVGDLGIRAIPGVSLRTAGAFSVTATDTVTAGLSLTLAPTTVNPDVAAPTYSSITVAPANAPADGSSPATISVVLKDAYNNAIPGISPAISLSGTGHTLGSFGITNASGQATAQLTSTVAETKTMGISSPAGLGSLTTTVSFSAPGILGQLAFTTQPSSTGFTGQPLAGSPVVATQNLSSVPFGSPVRVSLGAYLEPTCTVKAGILPGSPYNLAATANPVLGNGTQASFSGISIPAQGVVYLKAQAKGFIPACSNAISLSLPGAPAKLRIKGAGSALMASCSPPITAQLLDELSNPMNPASPFTVTLAGQGSGQFYLNSDCTGSTGSVTIPTTSSTATFYYRAATAQKNTFTASNGSVASATKEFGVLSTANAVATFDFDADPNFQPGVCFPYTVTRYDQNHNPPDTSSPTVIQPSSTGGGLFYANASCTTPVSTVSIGSGSTSATFYVRESAPGFFTLSGTDVSGNAVMGRAGFHAVHNAQQAMDIAFINDEKVAPSAGRCLGVGIALLDEFGFTSPAPSAVTLPSSATSGVQLYSDNDCQGGTVSSVSFAAGQSVAIVHLKTSSPTFSDLSIDPSPLSLSGGPRKVGIGFGPATPTRFRITGSSSATPSVCTPITFTLADDSNNPVTTPTALTATVSTGSATGRLYSDSGCTAESYFVNFAPSTQSTTVYFQDTVTESLNAFVSAPGFDGNAVMIGSGTGGNMNWLQINGPMAASSGTCAGPYTVQSRDNYGPLPVGAAKTLNLGWSGGPSAQLYSNAGCTIPLSGGTITIPPSMSLSDPFYLYASTPDVYSLYANETGNTYSDGLLDWVAFTSGAASRLELLGNLTPSTNTCFPYLIVLENASYLPVTAGAPQTINLSATPYGGYFSDPSCSSSLGSVTIPSGNAYAQVFVRSPTSGASTLSVSGSGLSSASLNLTFSSGGGGGAATQLGLLGPSSLAAGSCTSYSVELRNSGNAPTSSVGTTVVTLSYGGGPVSFYDQADTTCSGGTITNVQVFNGSSQQSFRVKINTPGSSYYLYADSAPLSGTNMPLTVP